MTGPSFIHPVIEDQGHLFTCVASGGNPGAVINWHVNGNPSDGDVTQDNTTDTQTSHLTLIPKRSMHTMGCIVEQLPSRPPVFGINATLNVMRMLNFLVL